MPDNNQKLSRVGSSGPPQSSPLGMPRVWDMRHLQIATAAAGVALWSWNVDTDTIALDEHAQRLWGISDVSDFITFETLSARIHPEDLDRVKAAFTATREIFGPYETDFRVSVNDAVRWISARGRGDDEGIVGRIMFGIFLDVTERKMAEQARELVANEMSHRVKNIFATVTALTHISARSTATTAAMADDIAKRLMALSKAKALARPSLPHNREAIGLGDLLAVLLDVYDDKRAIGDRIKVSVPEIMVGDNSITTLALVVHELATNSLKYGALSAASGTLAVHGTAKDGEVTIVWTEHGGPKVAGKRSLEGFGQKLIKRSIVDYLDGSLDVDWAEQGVVVTIRVPETSLAA